MPRPKRTNLVQNFIQSEEVTTDLKDIISKCANVELLANFTQEEVAITGIAKFGIQKWNQLVHSVHSIPPWWSSSLRARLLKDCHQLSGKLFTIGSLVFQKKL